MRLLFIMLLLLIFCSCQQKKKVVYYNNGDVYTEYLLKNGKKNGILKKYYKGNKIWCILNYKDDILNGWATYYDSSLSLITREMYYYNDKIYTNIERNETGKCKNYYIRPLIIDIRDTITVRNTDSLLVLLPTKLNCKLQKLNIYIREKDCNERPIEVHVYNIKSYNYIYFPKEVFPIGQLRCITLQMQIPDSNFVCCPNFDFASAITQKYIKIVP
ncbi:MAG: hypothetical protein H6553_04140 [Chitinophagales bacterium]|nr:hypothetical protein [Chitinophagales bacterium]